MTEDSANSRFARSAPFRINLCDSEYCSPSKAFSSFRDAVYEGFLPWAMELDSDQAFQGRIESLTSGMEAMARVSSVPVAATRGSYEIAKASSDSFYANYVLGGELEIQHSGKTVELGPGDLIVYDSSLPVKMTQKSPRMFEHMPFRIPKAKFSNVQDVESLLKNCVIPADKMIAPLSSCLTFLSENLATSAPEELGALFDVCTLLFPVNAGCFVTDRRQSNDDDEFPNRHMRDLLNYIEENVSDPELSPTTAAAHLGISTRYVHKLFAGRGGTFSTYVMTMRLGFVRRDLISNACRQHPVFVLAFRWGFNDISTFIRAFKKAYGCSPSEYRSKF